MGRKVEVSGKCLYLSYLDKFEALNYTWVVAIHNQFVEILATDAGFVALTPFCLSNLLLFF